MKCNLFFVVFIAALISQGCYAAVHASNTKKNNNINNNTFVEISYKNVVMNRATRAIRVVDALQKVRVSSKAVPSMHTAAPGAKGGDPRNFAAHIAATSHLFPPLRQDEVILSGCSYFDHHRSSGWYTLDVIGNPEQSDDDQAYGAGSCEGSFSAPQVYQHYYNNFKNPVSKEIADYFMAQDKWVKSMVEQNKHDPYWVMAGLLRRQIQGIYDSVSTAAPFGYNNMTFLEYYSLISMGDLFDLRSALNMEVRNASENDWRRMKKDDFDRWFAINSHCSALIKVLPDFSDIFFGHSSWFKYTADLRVYKRISLFLKASKTHFISFSSYPGFISSFDDYYVTDNNLVVIETSISVFNTSVYDGNIKPQTASYWMRIMTANYIATSGEQWTSTISKYNSGTYNNQWMVLDLKLFTPGQSLKPNTLWIAEQMPGLVKSHDVTDILSYGYFPSYNVPMDKEIYYRLGYPEAVQKQGPEMTSYERCVRAEIFRRDQAKVHDMDSFQFMMQYNDYQKDPISKGNPLYAIASRMDLNPTKPQCFGAYDAKTSSYSQWMNSTQSILAFCGPTPQQPIFDFSTTKAPCDKAEGLPPAFQFKFMNMSTVNFPQ